VRGGARVAGRSRAGLVLVLGALTAFGPVSVDLYLPAFPTIARALDTDAGAVQLSLATYMIGLAVGQVLYGRLSDIYGRRRPMVAGISLYVAASVACAAAPSVETLVGLRLLQGLGGCAGIVIARAIVRDLFEGVEAARFFARLTLVFGVAPVVAPILGAQILTIAGWRAIFGVLAAYGVACLASVAWLPETLPAERRRAGGVADALVSYGMVLRNRAFLAYSVSGSLGGAAMMAYLVSSPAVVIDQFGRSAQLFGLVFAANALGFIVVSQLMGRRVVRVGGARVLRAGLLAQALSGGVLLALAVAGVGGLAALLVPMLAVVSSVGAILPPSAALAMTPFPHAAGAASAVYGTLQTGLAAAAAAVVSAVSAEPATAMGVVLVGASVLASSVLLLGAPRPVSRPSARAGVDEIA
jgi:DHA1 family bicyclomycin/chloramphenicol resistance-like MFS transporter